MDEASERAEGAHLRVAGDGDRLWGVEDVCAFLGFKKSKVYELAARGLMPCIRLPGTGRVRFSPRAVRTWAERHSQGGSKHER